MLYSCYLLVFSAEQSLYKRINTYLFAPNEKKKKYLIICKKSHKTKANLIPVNRKCFLKIQLGEHKYLLALNMSQKLRFTQNSVKSKQNCKTISFTKKYLVKKKYFLIIFHCITLCLNLVTPAPITASVGERDNEHSWYLTDCKVLTCTILIKIITGFCQNNKLVALYRFKKQKRIKKEHLKQQGKTFI